MKAVATDGGGGLAVVEVPTPQPPPGGALVRVSACGLCGSDLSRIDDAATASGRVLGHEVVGLMETPEGPLRVALAHHVPCGRCELCLSGHSSLCASFVSSGLDPGGFAEVLAVTEDHLRHVVFPLPSEVDDAAGTLLEPLSCVVRAVDTAIGLLPAFPLPAVGVASGGERRRRSLRVLVAGCGSVGLLFLAVLQAARVGTGSAAGALAAASGALATDLLTFLEPDHGRAALARQIGAAEMGVGVAAAGDMADVCFLTAPGALADVLDRVAPGGVGIVFAAPATPVEIDLDLVYRREVTLAGVRSGSPAHLRRALDLLVGGDLDLTWFRPEVVDLEGLPAAVGRYRRGESLKVLVRP